MSSNGRRVLFLAFFFWCLWSGDLVAVVWQDHPFGESAPREMTRVPVSFPERSGTERKSAFSLSFPLQQGALFDTRQLRMCTADGMEVPLQSALLEAWPDGSCKFLFLRGVLPFSPHENKTCYVEFGSRVLRSAMPGIVTASTKEKMLVDTGCISAELAVRKFQLPEKIREGETICGTFSFPASPDGAQLTVEESGRVSTLIALRNEKSNAVLRMRFFRELPLIALEYVPGGKETFPFSYRPFSPLKRAIRTNLPEAGKILWLDLRESRILPTEAEYPVEGIVSADYLAAAGLFPEAYRPVNESMRKFADQWVAGNRAKRDRLPLTTLAALWFRTGEREDFLPLMARLTKDKSPEANLIRRKIWLMTGLNSCWCEPVPESQREKPRFGAGTTAAAAERIQELPAGSAERNDLISLLSHGFDPASGCWKETTDARAALSGSDASPAVNLLCARILMQAANECGESQEGKRLAEISFAAVKRIFFERAEMEDFSRMGEWFRQAEIRLKQHPGERFEFNEQEYADAQYRMNLPAFAVKVTGKRFFAIRLRQPGAQIRLIRRPLAAGKESHTCRITDPQNNTVFSLTTEKAAVDRKIFLNGKSGGSFTLALEDDGTGQWDIVSGENAVAGLQVDGKGVLFSSAQWKQFFWEVPPDTPAIRFRFQPLSPAVFFRVQLLGPSGEELEIADFSSAPVRPADAPRKELVSPAPGVWRIRFHVSHGDAFFAADGKSPLLLYCSVPEKR